MNRHLAILRDDHLGDMILTTPLAHALASAGWEVTVLGKASWAPVWENSPHAQYATLETVAPDYPGSWRGIAQWLRKLSPTHILVPYYHPKLFWASLFSGRSNRYCQMGRFLGRMTLHHCLRTNILQAQRHMGDVWQDFAEAVGVPRQSPCPHIFLTAEEKRQAAQQIAQHLPGTKPIVIVSPFHGGNTCHLNLCDYVEIVRILQRANSCRIIITGLGRERASWQQEASALSSENLWVACGELSLRELFAVISHAQRIVSGGTGTLHAASALGVPSVAVICANAHVNATVWGNLAPGAIHLSPQLQHCAKFLSEGTSNCHFCQGPTPQEVAQVILEAVKS